MRARFLIATLVSVILSLGMGTTIAQTANALVDNQESSNPTKAPGKCTDPPSMTVDRTVNIPMAGSEVVPAVSGSDTSKPIHKKYRSHEKSGSTMPGGTNSTGDMSYSGVQVGGNDAATTIDSSYPGNSK